MSITKLPGHFFLIFRHKTVGRLGGEMGQKRERSCQFTICNCSAKVFMFIGSRWRFTFYFSGSCLEKLERKMRRIHDPDGFRDVNRRWLEDGVIKIRIGWLS